LAITKAEFTQKLFLQAMTMEAKKEIPIMSRQAQVAWTTLCTSLQSFGKLFSPSYRPQVRAAAF
jgi:hypothetical protein